MSALLDQPTAEVVAARGQRVALRALRSLAYSMLIGLAIVGVTGQRWWPTMVHSVCIGMLCWFFIDLGRVPASRWAHRHAPTDSPEAQSQWPGWPLMMIVIVVGSVLAFTLGSLIAGWLTGTATPGYFRGTLRETVVIGLSSLVPALVMTYWFYSRAVISGQEVAVQTAQHLDLNPRTFAVGMIAMTLQGSFRSV